MAIDTKTAREVAQALTKALGEKLDELKKSNKTHVCKAEICTKGVSGDAEYCKDHTPAKKMELPQSSEKANGGQKTAKMELPQSSEKANGGKVTKSETFSAGEVAEEIRKATVERITAFQEELVKMQKAEAAGQAELLKKSVGSLPSETPSFKEVADGKHPNAGPRSVFDVMKKGEWASKRAKPEAPKEPKHGEGSGGQLVKDAMTMTAPKQPKMPTLKPTGIPGAKAGDAPKAPKPPQAAGAAPSMHKMDLPQTPEKANGGEPAKKMELPQTSQKANGGKLSKEEMAAVSPVFKGDFGFGDNGKVATTPAQLSTGNAAAPKPQFTMAHLQAAKAKLKTPGK